MSEKGQQHDDMGARAEPHSGHETPALNHVTPMAQHAPLTLEQQAGKGMTEEGTDLHVRIGAIEQLQPCKPSSTANRLRKRCREQQAKIKAGARLRGNLG
jgi:hypothetical protein